MYQSVEQAERRYEECKQERIRREDARNEYQGNFPMDNRPFQERLDEHTSGMEEHNRRVEEAKQQEEEARRDLDHARDIERQVDAARMEGTREQSHLEEGRENDETERLKFEHEQKETKWARHDSNDRGDEEMIERQRKEQWAAAERRREVEREEYRKKLREQERSREMGHGSGRSM